MSISPKMFDLALALENAPASKPHKRMRGRFLKAMLSAIDGLMDAEMRRGSSLPDIMGELPEAFALAHAAAVLSFFEEAGASEKRASEQIANMLRLGIIAFVMNSEGLARQYDQKLGDRGKPDPSLRTLVASLYDNSPAAAGEALSNIDAQVAAMKGARP